MDKFFKKSITQVFFIAWSKSIPVFHAKFWAELNADIGLSGWPQKSVQKLIFLLKNPFFGGNFQSVTACVQQILYNRFMLEQNGISLALRCYLALNIWRSGWRVMVKTNCNTIKWTPCSFFWLLSIKYSIKHFRNKKKQKSREKNAKEQQKKHLAKILI